MKSMEGWNKRTTRQ